MISTWDSTSARAWPAESLQKSVDLYQLEFRKATDETFKPKYHFLIYEEILSGGQCLDFDWEINNI